MKEYSEKERKEFIKDLPRKRCATGVVLRNNKNEWLLLQTNYHNGKYTFPGGIVEQYESPWQGAAREIKEEINIDISVFQLLTITNISHPKHKDEMILFYFDGGILTDSQIENMTYVDGEIIGHIFVPENQIVNYLRNSAHTAFKNVQSAIGANKTLLFEINN